LRFQDLRLGHQTWLVEDSVPAMAQVIRTGPMLVDRIQPVLSPVASGLERRMLEQSQTR
jgi:hypothetical protein